jgi:acyl-CoA synthetase (AMP-forming)/AMP-acid ligase II
MTNVHLRQPAGIATRSRSLVELLRSRAAHQPQRLAYTFLDADGRESALLTYARLDRRARGVAALLQERGAAGERVLLLYPHGPEYLAAFVGCLYAGAVAVPAYPPRFNQSRLRLEAIVADAQATLALTTHDLLSRLEPALADAPQLRALDWVATDAGEWDPESWREPGLAPGSLAYLQ